MIGIIAGEEQLEVVREFFELFKTPWEIYQPGRTYDVVLTTGEGYPSVRSRLLVVYSSQELEADSSIGCVTRNVPDCGELLFAGSTVPIYCGLREIVHNAEAVPLADTSNGAAVVSFDLPEYRVIRAGYDLFEEIRFLLSEGQPVDRAGVPTLDLHIRMLRQWILSSNIPLVEIAPSPAGYEFTVCLTHDIDFTGLRNHKFDRSFWGFAYRASIGSLVRVFRGRLSVRGLFRNLAALAASPFVLAGWAKDFWEPFGWYLDVETGLPATYYLIPFKGVPGEHVPGRQPSLRAAGYDVADLTATIRILLDHGCEVGVHGLDAWHSVEKGREELEVLSRATGEAKPGIRMHWLLRERDTASTLERAGFAYDSTCGYNETVGYRAGTSQVFRSPGTQDFLELPLHIQDGALFYSQRLDLTESAAMERCGRVIGDARQNGGVLTLLWHDRSHGPERLWGGFYTKLLSTVKDNRPWFATGAEAVGWFKQRRGVTFEYSEQTGGVRITRGADGAEIDPPLKVLVFGSAGSTEKGETQNFCPAVTYAWNGVHVSDTQVEMDSALRFESEEAVRCLSH